MNGVVYDDAEPPEAYTIDLTPGDTAVDLSTVTSADLYVLNQDGTKVTWAATLTNQTSTTLTLTHVFVAGVDVPRRGTYVVKPRLTIPSGVVKAPPRTLTVKGAFEV